MQGKLMLEITCKIEISRQTTRNSRQNPSSLSFESTSASGVSSSASSAARYASSGPACATSSPTLLEAPRPRKSHGRGQRSWPRGLWGQQSAIFFKHMTGGSLYVDAHVCMSSSSRRQSCSYERMDFSLLHNRGSKSAAVVASARFCHSR